MRLISGRIPKKSWGPCSTSTAAPLAGMRPRRARRSVEQGPRLRGCDRGDEQSSRQHGFGILPQAVRRLRAMQPTVPIWALAAIRSEAAHVSTRTSAALHPAPGDRRNVEQGPACGMRPWSRSRARRSNADLMRVSGVRSPEGPLFRPTTRHPSTIRLEPAPPSADAGVKVERRKVFSQSSSGDRLDRREEILEDAARAEADLGLDQHAGDEVQSNSRQFDVSSPAAGVPVKPINYATSNFISLRLASGTRFLTFRISTPTT